MFVFKPERSTWQELLQDSSLPERDKFLTLVAEAGWSTTILAAPQTEKNTFFEWLTQNKFNFASTSILKSLFK